MEEAGLSEAAEGEPADVVVVNSCTVTEAADRECFSRLSDLHRENPSSQIIVTGCLVQRDSSRLQGMPGIRLLAGTAQKHRIGEWVRGMMEAPPGELWVEKELSRVYGPLRVSRFEGREKAFVKVQDGCDRACAFCKIPLVRGRSRSRDLNEVTKEVGRLVARGFREIVLTGVAIGLWGRECAPRRRLSELLSAVDRIPGRFRIRLSSLDPRDLDDSLIAALAGSSKVCRHLHLSLQSGSDPVLARMNRGYASGEYQGLVESVRRFWPDLGLTTDLIAGFPGEDEEEFRQTLRFCRSLRFAKVHVFPYSRRRGTGACLYKDQLPPDVIRGRAQRLRQAASETAQHFHERFLGTRQQMLVERAGGGYTGQFLRVRVEGDSGTVGELVPVEVTGLAPGGLKGKIFRGDLDKMTHPVPPLN